MGPTQVTGGYNESIYYYAMYSYKYIHLYYRKEYTPLKVIDVSVEVLFEYLVYFFKAFDRCVT